jgi:methionine-rich copper-binding protein CopC
VISRTVHDARLPRVIALVAALLLAVLAGFASASPARAHDELLGTDPAADSTVDELPAELRLTFSGVIAAEAGASEVQVTDASGASLADGEPTAQDNVLTQPLSGEASGAVTVVWKVVSSDGHPISGEYSFTVSGAPAPTDTGAPAPTDTGAPAPTETAEPTQTAEPTPTRAPAEDSTFGDVWPWVVFGLLGVAVLGGVVYLLASRARRERDLEDARRRAAEGTSGPGSAPPADQ